VDSGDASGSLETKRHPCETGAWREDARYGVISESGPGRAALGRLRVGPTHGPLQTTAQASLRAALMSTVVPQAAISEALRVWGHTKARKNENTKKLLVEPPA